MTAQEVIFVLLGVVTIGAGVLVVTTRQLVHAALWLALCFGALAGCYLVLTAEFVAWVQVLIYVGAIVVLLLFGIMLTRAPIGRSPDLDSGNRWAAFAVALATAGVLVTVMVRGFHGAYARLHAGGGAGKAMGTAVFRVWVLPFEVLSVLLLAALIGAIVLSRSDIGPQPDGQGNGVGKRAPGAPAGALPGTGPRTGSGAGRATEPETDATTSPTAGPTSSPTTGSGQSVERSR